MITAVLWGPTRNPYRLETDYRRAKKDMGAKQRFQIHMQLVALVSISVVLGEVCEFVA